MEGRSRILHLTQALTPRSPGLSEVQGPGSVQGSGGSIWELGPLQLPPPYSLETCLLKRVAEGTAGGLPASLGSVASPRPHPRSP